MDVFQNKVPTLTTLFQVYATEPQHTRFRFSLLEYPSTILDSKYTMLVEEFNPQGKYRDAAVMLTSDGFTNVNTDCKGHPWELVHTQWNQWISMYSVLDWNSVKLSNFQKRTGQEWAWHPKPTDFLIDRKVAQFRENMTPEVLKQAKTHSDSGWFSWVRKQVSHTISPMEF